MEREIKFRAWHESDGEKGEMIYQKSSHVPDIIKFWQSVYYDANFMQFTGLKDKNGKEIYKGDVLKLAYGTIKMIGYVKAQKDGEWIFYKDEGNFLGVHHNKEHISIIGNIHENPELLD